jgi:predicted nuclease of restriction endonuclease-like RecB superfamily
MAEASFAEYIKFELKMPIFYEPVMLRMGGGKRYIPDFYLPDSDLFIEIKGNWWPGSKSKFSKGQDILGKHKLILVPPEYFSWFNKKHYILDSNNRCD